MTRVFGTPPDDVADEHWSTLAVSLRMTTALQAQQAIQGTTHTLVVDITSAVFGAPCEVDLSGSRICGMAALASDADYVACMPVEAGMSELEYLRKVESR